MRYFITCSLQFSAVLPCSLSDVPCLLATLVRSDWIGFLSQTGTGEGTGKSEGVTTRVLLRTASAYYRILSRISMYYCTVYYRVFRCIAYNTANYLYYRVLLRIFPHLRVLRLWNLGRGAWHLRWETSLKWAYYHVICRVTAYYGVLDVFA